jgi:hypothetical protein
VIIEHRRQEWQCSLIWLATSMAIGEVTDLGPCSSACSAPKARLAADQAGKTHSGHQQVINVGQKTADVRRKVNKHPHG